MLILAFGNFIRPVAGQITVSSLAQLRAVGAAGLSNTTITLAPGEYWLDGNAHGIAALDGAATFLDLGGTNNTYNLAGAEIKLDTRELHGYSSVGRVVLVHISGDDNTVNDLDLKGYDIDLDTDPNAERDSEPGGQFVRLTGNNLMLNRAEVRTRGSSPYGLGDAFGKGGRPSNGGLPPEEGGVPFLDHDKMSGVLVAGSTDAVVDELELTVNAYGHGFFVQSGSTNTAITNSTVTGELFSSNDIINHQAYQEYGVAVYGNPVPADQLISGGEGGVRMYTGTTGLTVDNVTVTNMRSGFATTHAGGVVTMNNVQAYGNESAFGISGTTTITNAVADAVNGPVLVMDRPTYRDADIEIEIVGDQPINHTNALIYSNGARVNFDITSDLPAEYFSDAALIRFGEFYWDNWRESEEHSDWNVAGYDQFDSVLINDSNAMVVLSAEVYDTVGYSRGGVISNGLVNYYDGITHVLSGSRLEVDDVKDLGNGQSEYGAEFDGSFNVSYSNVAPFVGFDPVSDNGTVVEAGATLELVSGVRFTDEQLTISGDGVDGLGALYAAGTGARFGSSNAGDLSTIVLDGNASIGVVSDLSVGQVQGAGNLTKLGVGVLTLGKSNTFTGDLIVDAGQVYVRGNGVRHGLTVAAGATIASLSENGYNTTSNVLIDGTLDLNGRSDEHTLTQQIGSLTGDGAVVSSNPEANSGGILNIVGEAGEADFAGSISMAVNINKSGDGTQIFSGNLTYTGTTSITDGTLLVDGDHTGGGAYTVAGGTLGGSGTIDALIAVEAGGAVAPGNSAGMLTVEEIAFMAGSTLEIEIGGLTAGDDFDFLLADTATLGGDLSVSLLDLGGETFLPSASDDFAVIVGVSLLGEFDNVANGERIDTVGGEGSFLVTYNSNSTVQLSDFQSASLPGDFDLDGDVDGSDFLAWQRQGLGQEAWEEWNQAYAGNGGLAATQSVPEPGVLVMVGVEIVCLGLLRFRRG